jgi:hypothetical protein
MNVLEVDPLLLMGVIRLRRHDEGSEAVTLDGERSLGNGKGLGVHNQADQLEWMKSRNENGENDDRDGERDNRQISERT